MTQPVKIETANEFIVMASNESVCTLRPPYCTTKQQVYRLAAWLKLCAFDLPDEPGAHTFDEIEEAIGNT